MFPVAALYASLEGLSSTKVEDAHPRHTQGTASAVIWLLDISSSLHFAPSTTAAAFLARDFLANSRQLPRKDPQTAVTAAPLATACKAGTWPNRVSNRTAGMAVTVCARSVVPARAWVSSRSHA